MFTAKMFCLRTRLALFCDQQRHGEQFELFTQKDIGVCAETIPGEEVTVSPLLKCFSQDERRVLPAFLAQGKEDFDVASLAVKRGAIAITASLPCCRAKATTCSLRFP